MHSSLTPLWESLLLVTDKNHMTVTKQDVNINSVIFDRPGTLASIISMLTVVRRHTSKKRPFSEPRKTLHEYIHASSCVLKTVTTWNHYTGEKTDISTAENLKSSHQNNLNEHSSGSASFNQRRVHTWDTRHNRHLNTSQQQMHRCDYKTWRVAGGLRIPALCLQGRSVLYLSYNCAFSALTRGWQPVRCPHVKDGTSAVAFQHRATNKEKTW